MQLSPQDDMKNEQTQEPQGQSPSAGTMGGGGGGGGGDGPPPTAEPSMPSGTYRDDFHKEQTQDQQAMAAEMSKGHGQSEQGQSQQQNNEKTQDR